MTNVLQIKISEKEKECRQFNIIENAGGGDCLFLALLEFLRESGNTNITIPNNADDLRHLAVIYLLTTTGDEQRLNFDRFKEALVVNLQDYIPNLAKYGDNNNVDAEIVNSYWEYMTTPGKEGTFAELCAIAELFSFAGFLIRQNDPNNYSCYEFGFTDENDENKPIAYLLFSGNTSNGHFRLLKPSHRPTNSSLLPGKYRFVREIASPHHFKITIIEPLVKDNTQFQCDLCEQSFQTQRGMKVHRHVHTKKTDPKTPRKANDKNDIQIHSFDEFLNLLARCKNNIKVLKRIPRGARISAANGLAKRIEDCVANPAVDKVWQNLLLFAYTALRVPSDQSKKHSLTSLVKQNVENQKLQIPKSRNKKSSRSISQRVEDKIADGDVRGAVKILSSKDSLAKQDIATLEELKAKHPPSKKGNFTPEPPDPNIAPLQVSEKEVYFTIIHFPPGSSAGVDGFLPEHLKELTSPATGEAGLRLLRAITNLSNMSLTGKIQSIYTKILYGASLCALNKEEGGIRPIAVGNTFRRITAKLACASIRSEIGLKLQPRQTGFGCPNGAEAAAHATRTFVKKYRRSKKVILKIDFKNAFNEIDREKFLNDVRINTPAIYPFILQCYCLSTVLFFGEDIILSQNGAQQGDPCGPVLFCFAIEFIVNELGSEFVVFYLDDGTVGGEVESVLKDFRLIMNQCHKIGLTINTSKCELFFCSEPDENAMNEFNKISPGIKFVNELTLLGAPISENAIERICRKKKDDLCILFDRLVKLDSYHIAFYILKNCFAIPKLTYILRTTPLWNHHTFIDDMDNLIKATLETLTNCQMDTHQWILSSLPIHCGGLGVRRVKDVYLPAFLSSVNRAEPIVSRILNIQELNVTEISGYNESLTEWNIWDPEPAVPTSQKIWDQLNVERLVSSLDFETDNDKARFLAIQRIESSAWLLALPSREIGTLMNNNVFRISVGLRLGCDICKPHKCNCGEQVDSKGRHGLKCNKSCGRASRHSELNNIIKRALASADISAKLEPVGLCREDGKRVDGVTLIPWSKGRFMIWDSTCTDTFALRNIKQCISEAGKGAESAASRKTIKYASLIHQNYHFIPFAVETMGPWCREAIRFVEELGKMIAAKTCEARSTFFLKQRLSMAIQRGRPDQVHNCTITNISTTSLSVKCADGFNGGMKQSFMLEVKDMHTQELKVNYTSPEPRFAVSNLEAGHAYLVSVYAFNGKGRSDPTTLQTAMLRLPEKQLTSEKERPRSVLALTPMLSVVIGLAAAIVIGGLAIILALRVPCGKRRKRKEITQGNITGEGSPGPSDKSIGSKEIDGNESDEKNPDIIPDTMDSDDQIDYIRRRQHISTIDTNSPTHGLLSHQGTPPSQTYVPTGMPMHTPMGYCTLRNGTKQSANIGAPVSMSPVPNTYPNPQSTCTLPRHPNQHWPSYGGTIAGVRHIPQVQMCGPQPTPPSQIAMQHLNTRSRMCIGVAEGEASIDTPLMVKRESTV